MSFDSILNSRPTLSQLLIFKICRMTFPSCTPNGPISSDLEAPKLGNGEHDKPDSNYANPITISEQRLIADILDLTL